jgi:hypothetical protein
MKINLSFNLRKITGIMKEKRLYTDGIEAVFDKILCDFSQTSPYVLSLCLITHY